MNMAVGQQFDALPTVDDVGYAYFQKQVMRLTGIDLTAYKSQQMRRRLGTLLARNKAASLLEYTKLLDQPAKLQEFLDFFTINVSEFFRIPEKFQYLETKVLPGLLARGRELRVWSAGCSNGAEPYSLAMLLDEMAPFGRWSVLATDVDRTTLARAQRGDGYTPADVRNVGERRLARYFEHDESGYRVKEGLKRRVHFKVHDLLRDPFESGFHVILCRHVVIYFTEEAKDALYRKFHNSLVEGGVLFVGGTEIIPRAREIGFETLTVSFYRKPER
jgi:chemotaxis protein methyltransferase CheR